MIGTVIPQELLSLVVSMSAVPTIRCSPNGAASMIASSLSSLIRDQIVSTELFNIKTRNRILVFSNRTRLTAVHVFVIHF